MLVESPQGIFAGVQQPPFLRQLGFSEWREGVLPQQDPVSALMPFDGHLYVAMFNGR